MRMLWYYLYLLRGNTSNIYEPFIFFKFIKYFINVGKEKTNLAESPRRKIFILKIYLFMCRQVFCKQFTSMVKTLSA